MHSTSHIPRDLHGSNVVIIKRTPIPPLPADKKGFGFTSISTYSEEVSSIAPRSIVSRLVHKTSCILLEY
jgi:hypothetical protein